MSTNNPPSKYNLRIITQKASYTPEIEIYSKPKARQTKMSSSKPKLNSMKVREITETKKTISF